ncbi:site-2 protease family protein [Natronomonas sp. F2-12]|jgi:membrane-associated protease RseP (regulator of RpoE activity)|uniref:Site-2 protease family protein n=1 Tax=Natronomonas aquatica TaxID=2841590 RepID=A0A9R1CRZ3_9EURY|nr:site-2 protease family protein [Natronomonas aquatica]MCQ4332825.1 site-2 protease family protein [Natronomonas aquatica]
MNTLLWILVGILLYMSAAMALKSRGLLPDAVKVSGPIVTVHTKRGRAFLDRLAAPKRLWRAWGNFGVGIALVLMVGSFLAVLLSGISSFTDPQTAGFVRPQDALVIPGVNQFLPWAAAVDIVVGLLVGLVVHEGGHGILCRVEDIDIDSMGIALFAFVPMGAFVQPDEDSQEAADRGGKTRMFAAGVTNNFLVTVISFALLFAIVGSLVSVAPGVAVGGTLPGSAAEEAGIERGDVLVGVDGESVDGESSFSAALSDADREVTVDRKDGDPVTVRRDLIVTRAVVDGPIATGTEIRRVNGEQVFTESAFVAAVDGEETVDLGTENGTVRLPVGTFVSTVPSDGPLGSEGAPDTPTIVHSVGGEPTPDPEALSSVLSGTAPGDTVEVVVYHGDESDDPWGGDRAVYEVTLGEHPSEDYGFLGVGGIQTGTSGIAVDDFGIDAYPADRYHATLGGSGLGEDPVTTFVSRTFAALVLPFMSMIDPNAGYNFAGFNGELTNFYSVSGPLGAGVVFALVNVLFWTGWVNINLGIFNCIPSYPLDGGHILRSSVEATLARLPGDGSQVTVSAITGVISVAMILSLLGMLFAPWLLG